MKLALNCARVAGTEILDRAAAKGLARVLDLPGPAARCWAAAAAFAKADASARVVARVGYFAAQDDRIAHSLAADRVAAEVERCAALLGRPLDAALLHGPEEVPRDERRRVVEAAAAAVRATGGARAVGAATRDAGAVEPGWWDAALDGPLQRMELNRALMAARLTMHAAGLLPHASLGPPGSSGQVVELSRR